MKKWIQLVQKYIFPTMLIIFGVLFIYGLIFATPVSSLVRIFVKANGAPNTGGDYNTLRDLYPSIDYVVNKTQIISNQCLIFSIIGLVLCGISLHLRSQLRKRYYITNYVSLGVLFIYTIFISIYLCVELVNYVQKLVLIDLDHLHTYKWFTRNNYKLIDGFNFIHILGFVIFIILVIASINLVLLIVEKVKYEKEYKNVIEGGDKNALENN